MNRLNSNGLPVTESYPGQFSGWQQNEIMNHDQLLEYFAYDESKITDLVLDACCLIDYKLGLLIQDGELK